MEAPKNLRRPANWQDFESLCKKLWGEIWNCSEIQKNGRLGEGQSGVDIFGIPQNEEKYFGIQCKGKNEYTHAQLTKIEIDREIDKARLFEPLLKKFYFATTALNDTKIQEYVRKKNVEHISKGLFEVHVFGWESIVDLIDENKQTHDWYIKNQNFKSNKSVAVTFQNGFTEIECNPMFKQTITNFIIEDNISSVNPRLKDMSERFSNLNDISKRYELVPKYWIEENLSYFSVKLNIKNIGVESIENFKILFEFNGEIQVIAKTNLKYNFERLLPFSNNENTNLYTESLTGEITPHTNILVGDDSIWSEEIYIKPSIKKSIATINWKLIANEFKQEGILTLNLNPKVEINRVFEYVENPSETSRKIGEVEDYIIEKIEK